MDKKISIKKDKENSLVYNITDDERKKLGYFSLVEVNKEIKSATIRLFLFDNIQNDIMTDLLTDIYHSFIKTGDFYKLNVIVLEGTAITAFTRLGFKLEGILKDNYYFKKDAFDEYIFGVDAKSFNGKIYQKDIEIKTKRLKLKLADPSDAEDFLKYYTRNRSLLMDYESIREESFYTIEKQIEELKFRYSQFLNGTSILFGVYLEEELIGKIRISDIVYGSLKSATIGYSLDCNHLNKGYMSEVIESIKSYCFKELSLHRIEATTLPSNIPSMRVLEKCGFKNCGLIEKYLYLNGKWNDSYIFSLFRK